MDELFDERRRAPNAMAEPEMSGASAPRPSPRPFDELEEPFPAEQSDPRAVSRCWMKSAPLRQWPKMARASSVSSPAARSRRGRRELARLRLGPECLARHMSPAPRGSRSGIRLAGRLSRACRPAAARDSSPAPPWLTSRAAGGAPRIPDAGGWDVERTAFGAPPIGVVAGQGPTRCSSESASQAGWASARSRLVPCRRTDKDA